MTGLIIGGLGLLVAAGLAAAFAGDGNGNGSGNGNGTGNGNGNGNVVVTGTKPPVLPKTFDHSSWPAVRWALLNLGVSIDAFTNPGKNPAGEGAVRKFQLQYNAVSKACQAGSIAPAMCPNYAMGRLKVDDRPGPMTKRALEVALALQKSSGITWTAIRQAAGA